MRGGTIEEELCRLNTLVEGGVRRGLKDCRLEILNEDEIQGGMDDNSLPRMDVANEDDLRGGMADNSLRRLHVISEDHLGGGIGACIVKMRYEGQNRLPKVTQNSNEQNLDKSIDENLAMDRVSETLTGNLTGNIEKNWTEENETGRLTSKTENLVTDSSVVVKKSDRKWTSPFEIKNISVDEKTYNVDMQNCQEDLRKIRKKKKEITVSEWKKIFDSGKKKKIVTEETDLKKVLNKQKIQGKKTVKNQPKNIPLSSSEEILPKAKKIQTPMKSKKIKGGGGLKKDTPQDDQRKFNFFGSSNGPKFKKILQQFKDGEEKNGRTQLSMEPDMKFTSSKKQVASSSENQTRPYCGDQLEIDLRCVQSVQANGKDRPGDETWANQWERYTARDGPESAER